MRLNHVFRSAVGNEVKHVNGFMVAAAVLSVWTCSSTSARAQGLNCGCIDAVFVVDDTSSMTGAIANVQAGLSAILAVAKDKAGGDLRVAVVSFKDSVSLDLDYSSDNPTIEAAVAALSATGGAGEPEALDEALLFAVGSASACSSGTLSAVRAECLKKVFLITDARPGGCDDTYAGGVDDVAAHAAAVAAAAAGFRVNTIHVVDGFEDAAAAAVLSDMSSTTSGTFTEVPLDGSGTSDAIIDKFVDCGGAGEIVPAVSEWGMATVVLLLLAGLTIKFGALISRRAA